MDCCNETMRGASHRQDLFGFDVGTKSGLLGSAHMSERGKALFDRYVASHMRDPTLAALPVGTHVFNLTSLAAESQISLREIVEEVGPLIPAITKAK